MMTYIIFIFIISIILAVIVFFIYLQFRHSLHMKKLYKAARKIYIKKTEEDKPKARKKINRIDG